VFFFWIIGLATVVAVVFPFSTTAPLSQKAATGVVNLILGIAIGSLVMGVAARAVSPPSVNGGYEPRHRPSRTPDDRYR
jgi:hypothetical protein